MADIRNLFRCSHLGKRRCYAQTRSTEISRDRRSVGHQHEFCQHSSSACIAKTKGSYNATGERKGKGIYRETDYPRILMMKCDSLSCSVDDRCCKFPNLAVVGRAQVPMESTYHQRAVRRSHNLPKDPERSCPSVRDPREAHRRRGRDKYVSVLHRSKPLNGNRATSSPMHCLKARLGV
jgi:hypothetical protein